ncbi:MAG: hypothetical protein MPJ08_02060 [Nitrosopumilus sp.]|nr:hypothetical protein [Nitrosopumilus sp.]
MAITQNTVYKCDLCGHRWAPSTRRAGTPRICPKCKETKWNAGRTDAIVGGSGGPAGEVRVAARTRGGIRRSSPHKKLGRPKGSRNKRPKDIKRRKSPRLDTTPLD